jgi:hypothetical protein
MQWRGKRGRVGGQEAQAAGMCVQCSVGCQVHALEGVHRGERQPHLGAAMSAGSRARKGSHVLHEPVCHSAPAKGGDTRGWAGATCRAPAAARVLRVHHISCCMCWPFWGRTGCHCRSN